MEPMHHFLKKTFFREKPVRFLSEGDHHPFDLVVDENEFRQTPDLTYNHSLHTRLCNLTFPDRADFLTYQLSLCESPDAWLEALAGMLHTLAPQDFAMDPASTNYYLSLILKLRQQLNTANDNADTTNTKIKWKGHPGAFFALMGELHASGIIEVDDIPLADLLFDFFEVNTLRDQSKYYQKTSFSQNIKATSRLRELPELSEIDEKVKSLIESIKAPQ